VPSIAGRTDTGCVGSQAGARPPPQFRRAVGPRRRPTVRRRTESRPPPAPLAEPSPPCS